MEAQPRKGPLLGLQGVGPSSQALRGEAGLWSHSRLRVTGRLRSFLPVPAVHGYSSAGAEGSTRTSRVCVQKGSPTLEAPGAAGSVAGAVGRGYLRPPFRPQGPGASFLK